jgi:hypothetical protein
MSVGGAALVTGIVLNVLTVTTSRSIVDASNAGKPFDPSAESNGRAFAVAGPVLDAVGGAALVTGAVVYYLGVRDRKLARASAFVPTVRVAASTQLITWGGSF